MKTFAKILLAAGIAALPVAPALAASACSNPNTDFDQVYCYTKLFIQADADLNVVYKNLVAKLNADGRAALKKSELAWIKTRNGKCTESRSNDILVDLDCTVEQTVSRTNWLNDRLRECSASGCMNEKLK